MKTLMTLILSILFVLSTSCTNEKVIKQETRGEATGKSNGGDNLPMEPEMIKTKLKEMKPLLHALFEGLRDQAIAEILVPTSTDLDGHAELVEVLIRMTHIGVGGVKVFEDIDTENNIVIQDGPCEDYEGDDHFAATNLEDIGGDICFSIEKISSGFPADSEKSFDIQILALAAHEFLHHFYASGSTAKDEVIADLLQRFVVYQLHKYSEFDEDIIATNSYGYLARFEEESKRLLRRSRQAHQLTDDELDSLLGGYGQ